MATHSSVLAWRIPGMGEPGGLPSMGSHRVGQAWSDLAIFHCIYVPHFLFPFFCWWTFRLLLSWLLQIMQWTHVSFWITVFSLDSKEIKPVNSKGKQPWTSTGRTDAEAETPILWPPDVKSWLIGKDPDAGKDWRQKEKGIIEDEMVGWHHRLSGHEFEQTLGDGEGQGSLASCSPWGHKVSDTTEWLNWTDGWFTLLYSRN